VATTAAAKRQDSSADGHQAAVLGTSCQASHAPPVSVITARRPAAQNTARSCPLTLTQREGRPPADQPILLTGWARTAAWRAAAITAAGVTAAVLVQAGDLDQLVLPVGLAAAAVVGWRLGSASPATPARSATAPGASGPPLACSAGGTGTAGPG
jgi:hypothetical protein